MHSSLLWLPSLFLAAAAAPAPVRRAVPDFLYDGDVGWTMDTATLAASMICPHGYPTAASPPVLLVHGTFASGNETWNQTYVPALLAQGYTACYLELRRLDAHEASTVLTCLAQRAGIDMQVSSEYIAYNLHYISYLSGGLKTAVITHSQGGPDTMWALEWWPSVWAVTSMYLPLSPDNLGVTYASTEFNTICPLYQCEPSIWQQMVGSAFLNALRRHKNFRAVVPATLVWTVDDEIVTPPNDNAMLTGGTTIGVQEVCAGRTVDHVYIVDDAVSFAVMLDALQHSGTASKDRVIANNPDLCTRVLAPGMKPGAVEQLRYVTDGALKGFALGADRVPTEPPLAPYVYTENS